MKKIVRMPTSRGIPATAPGGLYAPLPTISPTPAAPVTMSHEDHERMRRLLAREPHVPDNDLFGSLSGAHSPDTDWRDVIDGVMQTTITPAASGGQASASLPVYGSTGNPIWGAAALAMNDPASAVRLCLCVRWLIALPAATTPTGMVWLAVQTTGGDLLPIGAGPAGAAISGRVDVVGPNAIPDILLPQQLLCNSVGVGAPAQFTIVLGVALLGVRGKAADR